MDNKRVGYQKKIKRYQKKFLKKIKKKLKGSKKIKSPNHGLCG
jgi:hypothetical protein